MSRSDRIRWIAVLAAGFVMLLPWTVRADDRITVAGEALVQVVPDEVIFTLGVETKDQDLKVAKKDNDELVKKILASAKAQGIEPKHIQTDFLSIEPRYKYEHSQEVFLGYFVRKTVVVTLKDVSKFEDVLSNLLEMGANYLHGVDFRTTELRQHRDKARSLAIKAALEKGTDLASDLGRKVGKAHAINESPAWWGSSYGRYWGQRHGQMSQNVTQQQRGEGPETQETLALGQISVKAQVSVIFALE
jgi:uncharacterized protein